MKLKKFVFIVFILLASYLFTESKEIDFKDASISEEIIEIFDVSKFQLKKNSLLNTIVNGEFFNVISKNKVIGKIYIGRVDINAISLDDDILNFNGSGWAKELIEFFDYFILMDNNNILLSTYIFNYNSEHGYSICSGWWLEQFVGFKGESELEVGNEIDGISGATLSSNAITNDIKRVFTWISKK